MSEYATFNGLTIVDAVISIPFFGNWHADIGLEKELTGVTSASMVVADLSLTGTVMRDGNHAGKYRARVVGGKNGWPVTIPAAAYHHDAGVKLSTVIGDAARAVGETVTIVTDRTIGTAYVRQAGAASRVLNHLADDVWYMRTDGVTYVGPRVNGAIKSTFAVTAYDPAVGRVEVATEAIADFMPGRSFSGDTISAHTIGGVVHTLIGGKLRTMIMVTP